MKAWQTFGDVMFEAMDAGKRAKMRDFDRWLKAHPLPAVTIEQLIREAYEMGQRANAPVTR